MFIYIWKILYNAYKELLNPRVINIFALMYFRLPYKAESCIYAVKRFSARWR